MFNIPIPLVNLTQPFSTNAALLTHLFLCRAGTGEEEELWGTPRWRMRLQEVFGT